MISVLGSKKAALGPPGCTLVIKGTRVWLRNTLLSKSCSQEYKYTKIQIQTQLFPKQHFHKNTDKNTKLSVKTMQSGRRKGASIICIIGGNKIDEKTFAYAWGLYFCSVFVVCKREKLYQRKLRGQPGREHSLVFVSTPGNVLEQKIILTIERKRKRN